MRLILFITCTVSVASTLCHAQQLLKLNEKSGAPFKLQPLEHKFDTARMFQRMPMQAHNSPIDQMPVSIPDSSATDYFKSQIILFNKKTSTVYNMPNALKKTFLADPAPNNKSLLDY